MAAFRTGILLRSLIFILLPLSFAPFLFVDFSANRANAGVNLWVSNGLEGKIIFAIAIDSSRPTTLYAGTKYGVSKSIDGGLSWQDAGSGLPQGTVWALAIDHSNPGTLYAGTDEGVFKSTDGGSNWVEISSGLGKMRVTALVMDPLTSRTLYVGTDGGVFKATDGGLNWVPVNAGIGTLSIQALAIDPPNPRVLYAAGNGSIFKSVDGGEIWKSLNVTQTTDVWALAIDPLNSNIVYAADSGLGVFKSQDGGLTWVPMNVGLTNTHAWSLAIDSLHSNILYAGTEGGVFKSADGGGKWVALKEGLPNTPVLVLTASPSDQAVLYAGTEGGGVFKIQQAGMVFAVNCGGPQYVGKDGITYQGDTYFSGGGTYATTARIAGTEDGVLYQSERFGNFSYKIPVANGNYSVTLKFAEIYDNSPGTRVFSVNFEGKEVISKLDIFSKVAKNKAYDVTIPASVGDGVLNIEFKNVVGNAKVSAIVVGSSEIPAQLTISATAGAGGKVNPSGEVKVGYGANQEFIITPDGGYHVGDVKVDGVSQGVLSGYTFANVVANHTIEASFLADQPGKPVALAVNCGGPRYVAKDGTVYQADVYSAGGGTYTTAAAIAGTEDGVLYQSERYGAFAYNIPVANGNYSVTLKFAEVYNNSSGTRVFNVNMEGKEVISKLDIFAKVGKNKAYDAVLPATVLDGVLNIEFKNVVGNAKVSAIAVSLSEALPQVVIKATARQGGNIAPSGDVMVNSGGSQVFAITPGAGYRILDVKVDGASQGAVNSYEFKNVTTGHTIEASFLREFVITATAGAGGKISPAGEVKVGYGSSQEFIITPDGGYHVGDVKVDGVSQGTPGSYTFNGVMANHTIEAAFLSDQPGKFILAVNCGGPQYTVKDGTVYKADAYFSGGGTYTTTAAIAGTEEGVLYQSERYGAIAYNIPVANGIYFVAFKFAEIYDNAPGTRVFNVNMEGQEVISKLDIYDKVGKNKAYDVIVPATVTDGVLNIQFKSVVGNAKVSGIVVNSSDVLPQFVIAASAGWGGQISPSGEVKVNYGLSQMFTITPDAGFRIMDVKVDGASQGAVNTYEFKNVSMNHRIETTFLQEFVITATSGVGGQISPSGEVKVGYGGSQEFTITPDPGYRIENVVVDGVSQNAINYYRFVNVESNHTIGAIFSLEPSKLVFFAVNCGGPQYVAKDGTVYQKDTGYSGGTPFSTTAPIEGTSDGPLYQTERYSKNFPYSIPLPNGDYLVVLKFAEIYSGVGVGTRVFDVRIEGVRVVQDLDLFVQVGKNRAYDVSIPVALTDGMLNIDFVAKSGTAKINAILVKENKIPPTVEIRADPEIIVEGGCSVISWETTRADSASMDQGIGAVPVNGSTRVCPAEDTTYTIVVQGVGGSATKSVTVKIGNPEEMKVITTVAGNGEEGNGRNGDPAIGPTLNSPRGVAVDVLGHIYIADQENSWIRRVEEGKIFNAAGSGQAACWVTNNDKAGPYLGYPEDVAIDSLGNLYIVDSICHRIRKVDGHGDLTNVAGSLPPCCRSAYDMGDYAGDGESATGPQTGLNNPQGVAVDSLGNFYIADCLNNRVRRVDTQGIITTVAGTGEIGWWGDGGLATQAQIWHPSAVTLDSAGNLYISDMINGRVRKVDTKGIISTVAGGKYECIKQGGMGNFRKDVPAVDTCLGRPRGLALDEWGNLYIADQYLQMILKVDTEGIIRVVAGTGESGDGGDYGEASLAKLHNPSAVAVDAFGNLYIADEWNNRIRKVAGVFKPTKGVVRGHVSDAATGSPVGDVIVTVTDGNQNYFMTKTRPTGDWSISRVAPGEFTVVFEKSLYFQETRNGSVAVGKATDITLVLNPVLSLEVKIDSPLDGAEVFANPVIVAGRVNNNGEVKVNGVQAVVNNNTFSATVPLVEGNNPVVAEAKDQSGQTAKDEIFVRLVLRGIVSGKITDGLTGLSVSKATVTVTDSLNVLRTALTDQSGNYSIPEIYAGAFSGEARKDGYGVYSFTGVLVPGQTTQRNGALSPVFPKITNIAEKDITTDSVTITWETDQPADSRVDYGLTEAYGSSVLDSALTTIHVVTLPNLSPGTTYHYKVTSKNGYGFPSSSGDRAIKTINLPIGIMITNPSEGGTVNSRYVTVIGWVNNPSGIETGVVVNGVMAVQGRDWFIPGNMFVANHVPLQEGENVIEAVATDEEGQQKGAPPRMINVVSGEDYVRMNTNIEMGPAPLEATFTIDSSIDLSNCRTYCQGLGKVEFSGPQAKEFGVRFMAEGIYVCTVQCTSKGEQYEDMIGIAVVSKEGFDNILKAKWEAMRSALLRGDIEGALTYFIETSRDRYRQIFVNFGEQKMQAVFGDIVRLQVDSISERVAYCGAIRREDADLYSYPVTFILDGDGIWKIKGF